MLTVSRTPGRAHSCFRNPDQNASSLVCLTRFLIRFHTPVQQLGAPGAGSRREDRTRAGVRAWGMAAVGSGKRHPAEHLQGGSWCPRHLPFHSTYSSRPHPILPTAIPFSGACCSTDPRRHGQTGGDGCVGRCEEAVWPDCTRCGRSNVLLARRKPPFCGCGAGRRNALPKTMALWEIWGSKLSTARGKTMPPPDLGLMASRSARLLSLVSHRPNSLVTHRT